MEDKKKIDRLTQAQKGPKVWLACIEYTNLLSRDGVVIPYIYEDIYCPTMTSINMRMTDSILDSITWDQKLSDFLFKDNCEELKKLLASSLETEPSVFTSPFNPKTTISIELEEVYSAFVDNTTSTKGRPTVSAEANFVELTAITDGLGELVYLRADSILAVLDTHNDMKTLKSTSKDEKMISSGSVVYTNCPGLLKIKVRECPAFVFSRIRSIAPQQAEILAFEGLK